MGHFGSIETDLKNIQKRFTELKDICNRLQAENAELKSEHYKDNELSALRNQIKDIYRNYEWSFNITPSEKIRLKEWQDFHVRQKHWDKKKNQPKSIGAAGGRYEYIFLPTGLGTFGTCKCTLCKEEFEFKEIR